MHGPSLIQAVIEVIATVEISTLPADNIITNYFRMRRYMGSSDRRFISESVYEIIRNKALLSWFLGIFEDGDQGRINNERFARLLVLAWMLYFGCGVKDIEAAFSGVQYGPRPLDCSENMAVKLITQRLTQSVPDNIKNNIPDWIAPLFKESLGPRWEDHAMALNKPANVDLRVNTLQATRDQVIYSLTQEGITAAPTRYSPWGVRISGEVRPSPRTSVLSCGLAEVQDEGSQLVALATGVQPGQTAVDFCAGAGGKTLAMSSMMENKGVLYALDISQNKLNEAKKRFKRNGVDNVRVLISDKKWMKRHEGFADVVLVDVPCSGSGTWRRNPDIKWRLNEKDLNCLITLQSEILEGAKSLVKKGGKLIYATCSLLKTENDDQVRDFLNRNMGFILVNISVMIPRCIDEITRSGFLCTSPLLNSTDGFFAAVLKRE